jgi:dihydroorotate dehydrogenase
MRHGVGRIDAERAHGLGTRVIDLAAPIVARRTSTDSRIAVDAFGLRFSSPLVLAAGFDKNAEHLDGLLGLGFGAVEVGTVTALPQPGNPRPRLFRLPADGALLNRMGFNNDGADVVARRLARWRSHGRLRHLVVGVNIGKSKLAPPEGAAADYRYSALQLAAHADYMVVNVSSPNTPGLRDLQAIPELRQIIRGVSEGLAEAGRSELPLLVKIAPDLADDQIEAVADLALERGLAGLIATNTTVSRSGLVTPGKELEAAGAGGLSGRPLNKRSLAVLEILSGRLDGRAAVVSVGGVSGANDIRQRLDAGAAIVQAYTGFVYGGPLWPKRVNHQLTRLQQASAAAQQTVNSHRDAST